MQKILVTISGYYERFQINTIESCLKRAKYPERISFAIAHHEDHIVNTDHLNTRVSRYIIPKGDKVGVQKPKNILSKMIKDEDFLLSIDSHVIMMPDWDELLIEDYNYRVSSSTNKKIVISGNFGNSINVGDMEYNDCVEKYFNNEKFFSEKEFNLSEEFIGDGPLQKLPDDYHNMMLKTMPILLFGDGSNLKQLTNIYSGNFSFYPKAWFNKYNFSDKIFFSGDQPETAMNIYTSGYDIWMPKYKYHTHMSDHPTDAEVLTFIYAGKTMHATRYLDIKKDMQGRDWFLSIIKNGYGDERPRSVDDFFNFFNLNKNLYIKN